MYKVQRSLSICFEDLQSRYDKRVSDARSNVFAHIFSESSFWNPILFQHYFIGITAVIHFSAVKLHGQT